MLSRLADPAAFTVGRFLLPRAAGGSGAPEPAGEGADAVFVSWSAAGDSTAVEAAAARALRQGLEPVVCVSAAGRTREEVLEGLRRFRAAGVRTLLFVTGDYPAGVPAGRARFELDSVQLLMLLRQAAAGDPAFPGDLAAGCVVSPFKDLEAELRWQYEKLARKVAAGAAFVVAQAGFDLRKHDELLRFCRVRGIDRPMLAHVLVPGPRTLAAIHAGRLPGIAIPEGLARRIAAEGNGAGGRRARLARAGRIVAALRGLGYRGVVLSGAIRPGEIPAILEEAGRHAASWRECLAESWPEPRRFFWFLPGAGRELNSDVPVPLARPPRPHPMYLLSRAVDYFAFGSWPPLFRLLRRLCRFCDAGPRRRRALWLLEYAAKKPVYGCTMCGDCTLYACGFLCCRAGCPKGAVNGPCGGSAAGRCEIDPQRRECFWVRVAGRLRGAGREPGFPAPPIPPGDRTLEGGCSWINFCLGRDHRRFGLPATSGRAGGQEP